MSPLAPRLLSTKLQHNLEQTDSAAPSAASHLSLSEREARHEREAAQLRELHATFFSPPPSSSAPSLLEARPGSFVPLDAAAVRRYLPEGLPPALLRDNEHLRDSSWMARESSQLLLSLLDRIQAKMELNGEQEDTNPAPATRSMDADLSVPRFTDRGDWPESRLR
ncbi:hypothetical protein EON64_05315, partial [archaeon]